MANLWLRIKKPKLKFAIFLAQFRSFHRYNHFLSLNVFSKKKLQAKSVTEWPMHGIQQLNQTRVAPTWLINIRQPIIEIEGCCISCWITLVLTLKTCSFTKKLSPGIQQSKLTASKHINVIKIIKKYRDHKAVSKPVLEQPHNVSKTLDTFRKQFLEIFFLEQR